MDLRVGRLLQPAQLHLLWETEVECLSYRRPVILSEFPLKLLIRQQQVVQTPCEYDSRHYSPWRHPPLRVFRIRRDQIEGLSVLSKHLYVQILWRLLAEEFGQRFLWLRDELVPKCTIVDGLLN